MASVHANHVRYGVESLPDFEQNLEILQSTLTTFACIRWLFLPILHSHILYNRVDTE